MGDPSQARARRSWLRLSIRGLMVLVLILGGGFGWAVHRAHVQRDAVEVIQKAGGRVMYDWINGPGKPPQPPGPKWFRELVGPDMIDTVVSVSLEKITDDRIMARVGDLSNVDTLILHALAPGLTTEGASQVGRLNGLNHIVVPKPTDAQVLLPYLWDRPSLEKIHLESTVVTDADLARLARLTDLKDLSLDGRRVTDAGFAHLAKLEDLQGLTLWECRVGDLSPLAGMKGLERLALSSQLGRANGGPPVDLAPLRGLSKLKSLSLFCIPVDDAGLDRIKGLTQLASLDVSGEGITDAGLASIATMSKLVLLRIRKSSIRDLSQLSPILPRLRVLEIGETSIADDGLRPLAGSTLRMLFLRDTALSDERLEHLVKIKSLNLLDISGSMVSDAGLARLAGLTQLKELIIERTAVSEATLTALRKALPRLTITR